MDFSNASGGIQVKLYTNKPYGDSISVIKKSDSEYVILMPETSNSMTASPILNPVSAVVRGVSVKTQQYENGVKGYTKITISTTKPIEVVPQVKSINASDYQLSENDYSELLQASKKTKTIAKQKTAKPATTSPQQTHETKPHSKSDLKSQSKAGIPAPQQKAGKALNATSSKKIKKTLPKQEIVAKPQLSQKPVAKEIKKPITQPIENQKPAQQVKSVETISVPNQNQAMQPKQNGLATPAPLAQQPITSASQPQIPTQTLAPLTFTQKFINIAENPKGLLKYKDTVKQNIYIIVGSALALFILLLLGAKRMTKGLQKQKEAFAKNLSDQPDSTTNFMDKINENMSWQEKYQTYVEASNQPSETVTETPSQQTEQPSSTFESSQELNELFSIDDSNDNFMQTNVNDESLSIQDEFKQYESSQEELFSETEVPQHEISQGGEIFGIDKLDELFGVDEDIFGEENNFINEDFSFNETPEETFIQSSIYKEPLAEEGTEVEEIKSEYKIDAQRGFYLVDYKDSSALIGHIEDEVFVLKQFKEKIEGTLQARLDEYKGNSANYMTRVGDFKALVEVKPNDMNLLIEL